MSTSFLENRHSQFNIDMKLLFSFIHSRLKMEPLKAIKIVKGYENEVYLITTKQALDLIIRIHRYGEIGYEEEAWAIEQARNKNVPVAEILLIDKIEDTQGSYQIMIQKKIKGKPLRDLYTQLNSTEKSDILYQAGEILGRLHQVKVDGFYRIYMEHGWDFSSWEDVMNSTLLDRSKEIDHLIQAGFSEQEFKFMIEQLQVYKDQFPCYQPVLCHGDYTLDHIFVDQQLQISGIIDFGQFQGAPPIHDIALLYFEEPKVDIELLLQGYPDFKMKKRELHYLLHLHTLSLQMGYLAHYSKVGDTAQLQFSKEQLQKTLNILKST